MAIVRNILDLRANLPARAGLLGLDLGKATIGVAGSDPDLLLASPIETIARTKLAHDLDAVLAIYDARAAAAIVLGWPVNMDGSEGPRCQATRQFAHDLLRLREVPILLWDERWSTMAVERAMIRADVSRAKRAKAVDRLAAAHILQGALDALRAAARGSDIRGG